MAINAPLTLIRIASVAICFAIVCRADVEPEYYKAARFMDKKCVSMEPEECLNVVDEEIARQGRKRMKLFRDSQLLIGLERVSSLRGILESPSCTNDEYFKLRNAAGNSNGHKPVKNPKQTLRPFDLVVHTAGLKRAESCRSVYQKAFQDNYAKMSVDEFEPVRFVAKLLDKKEGMSNQDYMKWLIDFRFVVDEEEIDDILNYVDEQTVDDPEKCQFGDMFRKYVGEPCTRFVRKMGVYELIPMVFDAEMLDDYKGYDLDETRLDLLLPLYRTLALWRICRKLEDSCSDKPFTKKWIQNHKERQTCLDSPTMNDPFEGLAEKLAAQVYGHSRSGGVTVLAIGGR